jgi:hypothetical protein
MEIDTTKSQFSFLGLKQGINKVKLLMEICSIRPVKPFKKDIRYLKEYKSVKKSPSLKRILFQRRFGILWTILITFAFTRLKKTLYWSESYKIAIIKPQRLRRTLYP